MVRGHALVSCADQGGVGGGKDAAGPTDRDHAEPLSPAIPAGGFEGRRRGNRTTGRERRLG